MKYRLIVYGLLGMALAIVLSTQYTVDRPDAEMVIIVNPINPLNPVVKNPYQEEYERMLYPTVRISSPSGTGSGVIISVERRALSVEGIAILTAAHVVEAQSTVNIELYDSTVITGTVVITDTDKDLALIRINRDCFADARNDIIVYSARLAPENYTYYLFNPVYAIGCSLGLKPRPSFGHITSIEDSTLNAIRSTLYFEVSAPILPGNSGGPVYDARTYEVIGITVWVKLYNGQLVTTMAGVVPINQIYEFLESYKRLQ